MLYPISIILQNDKLETFCNFASRDSGVFQWLVDSTGVGMN